MIDRPHGIGGSDAAAALGVDPYRSPIRLWLELTGRVDEPRVENDAMYFGTLLEPVVREELERREGVKVENPGACVWDDDEPWRFCHPDGYIDPGQGIAELKTASVYQAAAWDDGPPVQYQAQAAHMLAVTGRDYVLFGALIGGQKFVSARVERDEKLIALLIDREREFWGYVERDEQPPFEYATASDLATLYPESEASIATLDDEPELIERLHACRAAEAAAKEASKRAELAVKARLGACEIGTLAGAKVVSWKSQTAKRIDVERLRVELPDVAAVYERVSSSRVFRVAS